MQVARDWILRAREADDNTERARCLRHAEALVQHASDWPTIAEEWAKLGPEGHADARRCADEAVTRATDEVFLYREAAVIHARFLADLARAREILDRCREVFAARPETRPNDWGYLGGGYVAIVGDAAAARRCLDEGVARATSPSVSELCDLAQGHVEHLGDLDTARHLIGRAAVLAEVPATDERDHGGWWSLANATRHALGDLAGAWDVLARGLVWADHVGRCLRIAQAVVSQAEGDATRRPLLEACIAKAETLAAGADDWIAVAGAWHEHRFEAAAVRRCLERALVADSDNGEGEARALIAHGYRHWLEDTATADRLAARGTAPADLVVVHHRLEGWAAEPGRLLDHLRARVTPKMLRTIAVADYGSDLDKHLAVLVDIHSSGLVPQPLRWHPREVLALTQWSDGDATDHVARAFACTVLCLDGAGPTYSDGLEQTVAVLIESCLVLGDEALEGAIGLLVTMCEAHEDWRGELAFCYLGLLIAAAARAPHDPRLPALAARVVAAAEVRDPDSHARPVWGWLLGQTFFDQRHELWRALAAAHLVGPPHLTEIGRRLAAAASSTPPDRQTSGPDDRRP